MLIIFLLALIHLVAAFHVARHFWRPKRMVDLPAVWILTAMTTFYGGPIVFGELTGRINRWTVVASAAIACALALYARYRRPDPAFSNRDILDALRRTRAGERILWACSVAIVLGLLLAGSILPIRYSDAASYHSLNPMRWSMTHRFDLRSFGTPESHQHYLAGEVFPNVKAVLPFLVLEYTNREDGTGMTQWPFLLLLVVCLFSVSRRLEFPGWATAAAVLFVLLAPAVELQSLDAYADLVFFAGQIAVVWACLALWQDGSTRRNVAMAALTFAFLVGSKPNALLTAAALGVAFLVAVYFRSPSTNIPRRVLQVVSSLVAVILACLILAGPWYIRGIRVYDNPVYPVEVKLGYVVIFPGKYGQNIASIMARENQKAAGLRAWWRMMNESYRRPLLASYFGGLGAQSLILGLPALALFLAFGWREGKWKRYGPVLLLFALMLRTSSTLLWPRMILFELAGYALVFAWLLTQVPRSIRIALFCIFGLLGAYNLARTLPAILHRTRPPELVAFPYLTGHRRQLEMRSFPDEFTALDYWREHVGTKGKVLALPDTMAWLARPLHRGASVIRVPRLQKDENVDSWADKLISLGATHLYAPRGIPEFDAAMNHPDRFHLLLHRLDSGAENPYFVYPTREAALFEILPPKEETK